MTKIVRTSTRLSQELYELFDAQRRTFTNGRLQRMIDKIDYVEMDVEYHLELDWTASDLYRINFRPETNQILNALFLRDEKKDFI